MKRSAALAPLSREHHEALVLARRACEPQRPQAEPRALRRHVLQRWTEHIAPHFAAEEAVLLPALRAAGCAVPAAQACEQHAHLRALVERLREGDLTALPAWGCAMREHVRWEERELFPLAQEVLDLDALQSELQRPESSPCED